MNATESKAPNWDLLHREGRTHRESGEGERRERETAEVMTLKDMAR